MLKFFSLKFKIKAIPLCICILFNLFFLIENSFAFEVPTLKAPVNDYAQIIPSSTEKSINNLLRELKKLKGGQIAVLTVKSLNGETIEQASIQTTDQWKLGSANNDNGVLILIAIKERRLRIEVGQGFEGNLTDSEASRIVQRSMIPLMKSGDPQSALIAGLYQVTEEIYPDLNTEAFFQKHLKSIQPRRQNSKPNLAQFIIMLVIFLIIIFINKVGGGGRGFASSGGFGGGTFGGGGGSFGGGGFGGGGGGFSGGGASGGW